MTEEEKNPQEKPPKKSLLQIAMEKGIRLGPENMEDEPLEEKKESPKTDPKIKQLWDKMSKDFF